MEDNLKTWDISALRWKWKIPYNQFTANVDSYQMKEWLLFNDTGNQANIGFMEFCVKYIILHSWYIVFFKNTYIQSRKYSDAPVICIVICTVLVIFNNAK